MRSAPRRHRRRSALVSLELVTVGRVSVDLYAREQGAGFAQVETFAKSIGGSPTNVAVAAARLGRRAAVITAVGDDPFGEYVRGALAERFGVDVRFVGTHPTLRTPLAFAAMDPPEDPQLLFYREPDAPDIRIELASIDRAAVREAAILWVSASALSQEPSRSTTLALMSERERAAIILDLDYRPTFWRDEAEASAVIGAALEHAGTAVGNREECRVAVGSDDPGRAADALLARGCSLAVVKQGGDGVLVATPAEREVVPGLRVKVVCGLGAGDAFGGALCHGLLSGWAPAECVRFANAAGAIVASRLLCADAMPAASEVEALLAR
jgi:5-dehydro-2-deoxygluconokinase